MSATPARIVVFATDRGVVVETRTDEGTAVSVCLQRDAVANLVLLLAQADDKHKRLARSENRSRKAGGKS